MPPMVEAFSNHSWFLVPRLAIGRLLQSLVNFVEDSLWTAGFYGPTRRDDARHDETARARARIDKLRRLFMRSHPNAGEVCSKALCGR